MNAQLDPETASLMAAMTETMSAPAMSAQELVAAQRNSARRQLDAAELMLANLTGHRVQAQEEARRDKADKLAAHKADEDATLARDAANVERLEMALEQARVAFAENATAFKQGRRAIEADCDAELSMKLAAISEEMEAAKLAKAMAEAALGAGAQAVGGAG